MDDILNYNIVKSEVLGKIVEMVRWNNAEIMGENTTKVRVKRARQENTYLEYIAKCIADLPMPD